MTIAKIRKAVIAGTAAGVAAAAGVLFKGALDRATVSQALGAFVAAAAAAGWATWRVKNAPAA